MECLDFERLWNEQFDAREAASLELQQELEAHAAGCPACRPIAARYQTLQLVLRSVARPPVPPADFPRRFLEPGDFGRSSVRHSLRIGARLGPFALAASLVAIAFLGWRSLPVAPAPKPLARAKTPAVVAEVPSRPAEAPVTENPPLLTDAFATAGSATWDLALATSAPAGRIGREFFNAATFQEPSPASAPAPDTELALALSDAQSEVLQSVGERVNAQVLPFSGTARHAFGFLLGRPVDDTIPAANPTNGG